MCPPDTSQHKTRNSIERAINDLIDLLKTIISHDEIADENVIRLMHWRLTHEHILTCAPLDPLTRRVTQIVLNRRIEDRDRMALAALCGSLARTTRLRSTAVALSRVLEEENAKRADAGRDAFEQEIIRLIESGATVNCGAGTPRVVNVVSRGRTVKRLTLDTNASAGELAS